MIDISKINLSRINLGQVQLPRIILGRSEAEKKPEPEPSFQMYAGWKFSGKTNEDADRDVVKDLSDNGLDITLHNFKFTPECGYDGNGNLVSDGDENVYITTKPKDFYIGDSYTVIGEFTLLPNLRQVEYPSIMGVTKDISFTVSNQLVTKDVTSIHVGMSGVDSEVQPPTKWIGFNADGKGWDNNGVEHYVAKGQITDIQYKEYGALSYLWIFGQDMMDNATPGIIKNLAIFKGNATKEEAKAMYDYLQSL